MSIPATFLPSPSSPTSGWGQGFRRFQRSFARFRRRCRDCAVRGRLARILDRETRVWTRDGRDEEADAFGKTFHVKHVRTPGSLRFDGFCELWPTLSFRHSCSIRRSEVDGRESSLPCNRREQFWLADTSRTASH